MSRSSHRRAGLLLGAVALLTGCARQPQLIEEKVPPFVFRSLNLRQQDKKGQPLWQLTSPEARYDVRRRLARALAPKGMIFREGKPIYALEASTGTVINDGEVILLEGRIRVRQLGKNPLLIQGKRVRWYPRREIMRIDLQPEVLDRQNRVTARRASFLFDKGQLELRGSPTLQRWSKRLDSLKDGPLPDPEIVVTATSADWQPGSGRLEARGPVVATRRPPGAARERPPQTVKAAGLKGNTLRQEFLLEGPVGLYDPLEKANLQASRLTVDIRESRLSTDQPFRGHRDTLQVRGRSFLIDNSRETVLIPRGCEIDRPGESLRASSCSWNWTTDDVTAEGGLEIRRRANSQITRGERLEGRLGKDAVVEITAPAGRVFSQFQVPRRSEPNKPRPPRPKPEPIRL